MNNALTVTFRISCRRLRAASQQADLPAYSPLKSLNRPGQIWSHWQGLQVIQHRNLNSLKPSFRSCALENTSALLSGFGKAPFSTSVSRPERTAPNSYAKTNNQNKQGNQKSTKADHPSSSRNDLSKPAPSASSNDSLYGYKKYPELRFKSLPQSSIKRIFGPTVPEKLGNDILRKLQSQRATGTLDDVARMPKIDPRLEAEGLMWLRSKYPFDEDAAIMKRIELEDLQTDAQLIASAERLGLYQPNANVQQIQNTEGRGIYGHSVLDDMHKHFEEVAAKKKGEAEKKEAQDQAEEIRNISQDSKNLQSPAGRAVLARRTESAEWVKRYKERAKVSDLTEPEKLHPFVRLWPSAIFTLIVIGASILFAQNYIPPPRQARLFPDTPPAAATVQTLIFINIAAFMMWKTPPLWRFMNRYCLLITAFPKWESILGNVFSHQVFSHLAVNMLGLWFAGTLLHDDVGRGRFLAIFFSCGAFASFTSFSIRVLSNNLSTCSLGASGAIMGLIAALCILHAGETFTFPFLPKEISPAIPATGFFAAIVGLEILAIVRGTGKGHRADRWSHIGGYGFGAASGYIVRRKEQQRSAQAVKRREPTIIEKAIGYGAREGEK